MKSVFAVLLSIFAFASMAKSDGAMFVMEDSAWRAHREHLLINEPDQKAVVYFSKGTEDLIISPSYEGKSSNFARVIPVPARPKVEILKGAIFHELAALTAPKPRPRSFGKMAMPAVTEGPVTVIERKTVGAYDVSVLSTTDGKSLVKWLKANKYHLPDKAVKPIQGYVEKGWIFVACRIKVPGAAKGLRTGTLAPIRMTFKSANPVYPMKLSAANPKPFSVHVYLIVPASELPNSTRKIALSSSPRRP